MREFWKDIKSHKFFTIFIMVIILILLYKGIDYVPEVWGNIKVFWVNLFSICQPIIIAAIMSYILKPLVNLLDKGYFRLFYKIKKDQDPLEVVSKKQFGRIRLLTIVTVMLVLGSAVAILIAFILEPFLNSLKALIKELPAYVDIIIRFLNNFAADSI